MEKFGFLTEVDIRSLWQHEQYDFSDWLAKEHNMAMLGNELGLTLTDISKEVFVGSYRCDLVAKDETTGTKVIIENQLESTNHDHLGKIITYASGLEADVVVWIVKEAREEHRSAIEWLNNKTVREVSFFLIEIHAYRIGDSLPAPKFVMIEKPNDFAKSIKGSHQGGELTKSESERLNFWTLLNETLVAQNKPFNTRKATTNNWYDVALGRSDVWVTITLLNQSNQVGLGVYIKENKDLFDALYQRAEEIHQEVGFAFEWHRLDNAKISKIIFYLPGLNFDNHDNYNLLIDDIIKKVVVIRKVFTDHLKRYK